MLALHITDRPAYLSEQEIISRGYCINCRKKPNDRRITFTTLANGTILWWHTRYITPTLVYSCEGDALRRR